MSAIIKTDPMTIKKKAIAIICINECFFKKINYSFQLDYKIFRKKSLHQLIPVLRVEPMEFIVLHIDENLIITDCIDISKIKNWFPMIPLIAITNQNSLELARQCGKIGIDRIIPISDLEKMVEEITSLTLKYDYSLTISELGIHLNRNDYSEIFKEAINIMETNYVVLMNVAEIASIIGITECTLSREFHKYSLPGPKHILMLFKVYHASLLMQNRGFNIREIASLSGFSNDKHMAECFLRVYYKPPGKFREQMILNTINYEH